MAVFEYRGLVAATGKQVHGVRDADNAKVLRAVLRREGVMLTSAQEDATAKRAQAKNLDLFAFARRVSVGDVAMMTRQLATLVVAGIPLVEAVAALTEQVEKLELKRVLTQVRDRLNEVHRSPRPSSLIPRSSPTCMSTWSRRVKRRGRWSKCWRASRISWKGSPSCVGRWARRSPIPR